MAKILIAKVGVDAHDMGVTVVSRWLGEAGHEVRYMGLYNSPGRVAEEARAFMPDVIGLSFLGAEPVYMSTRVRDELSARGLEALPLVVGGVITPEMAQELKALGVKAIFTPGTGREAILDGIAAVVTGDRRNAPPDQRLNPAGPARPATSRASS
ncbi:MAG: cobalamin-dependent protein [Rhodospirillaceae bacterium]|nr:cobalamin-dependent protein [Rhodospirillaceae bacterium]